MAIVAIVIIFIFAIGPPLINNSGTPGVDLTKINESGNPNGKIIHISDKDFEAFPQLAPVFHGTKQGLAYANGTRITYTVGFSFEEVPKFRGSIFGHYEINQTTGENEIFYEYSGNYYYFGSIAIP